MGKKILKINFKCLTHFNSGNGDVIKKEMS